MLSCIEKYLSLRYQYDHAARRADAACACQLPTALEDSHVDVYRMRMDGVATFQFDKLMPLTTPEERS